MKQIELQTVKNLIRNSEDRDQTGAPQEQSDQGPHCFVILSALVLRFLRNTALKKLCIIF